MDTFSTLQNRAEAQRAILPRAVVPAPCINCGSSDVWIGAGTLRPVCNRCGCYQDRKAVRS